MIGHSRQVYEFGPFRLIPKERLLLRAGQAIPLTAKAFDLLVVLVENAGHLVGKEQLMERLWPDGFVEEANLSVNVSALRRALGAEEPTRYIQTVPRHGYRFVEPVAERWEDEPLSRAPAEPAGPDAPPPDLPSAGLPPESVEVIPVVEAPPVPPPSPAAPVTRPRWERHRLMLGAVATLLLGLTGWGLRGPTGSGPAVRALAILPLENLSGDPSQDYLAGGITAALTGELAKIRTLRVVTGPQVPLTGATAQKASEIGRELQVDAVLTGGVQRTGQGVRVAVRLVDVETNRSLWSDTYERNLRDVLTLQQAVTRDIAGRVRLKVSPQDKVRFGGAGPVDPEAYDHYLRGQYHLYRQNKAGNDAAIAALERAVTIDPEFAPAHAELAQAYVWKLFLFDPKEKKWAERAFVEAEKALALDPDSAVAHLARGRLLWTPANRFPHEKAIREYRRALALNPNLDEARNQLALVYCHIGAFDEALEEARLAVATNPNNNLAQFRTGQTLNFQGRYDEALTVLKALPDDTNPALVGYQVSWALFNLGRKEEAAALLARLLRDYPEDPGGLYTSVQAVMAASAGQHRQAVAKVRQAVEKGRGFGHFHHTAYHLGCAYALMNQPGPAIQWLEAAADDGFPCYPLYANDRNLDRLRRQPRFVALIARLERQWEQYRTVF